MENHPGREGKTQGREARKAALTRVQVIAERHLDGGGVRVTDHGDTETVMGFRRQSSRDGVIDQNGVWDGNHLSGLDDEWGVVLPKRTEEREEAADGCEG